MSHNIKIIDNNRRLLLNVFKEVALNHESLSIATGYWDLLGTLDVFNSIKDYRKVRLLIGREPLIPRHKILRPEVDYPDKDFFYDLEQLQPSKDLQDLVKNIKKLISEGKLEIKIWKKSFLHAKCYIFGDYSSDKAVGIIGSSNFTRAGLTHNTELNSFEGDHRIVTFKPHSETQEVGHLSWFDSFWNDESVENWNGEFIELIGKSPVGDEIFSPYEMYIKTLYSLYKDEIGPEEKLTELPDGKSYMPHQVKNIHMLIRKLKKKKVAMLADSVGLGKTATAIGVIREYRKGLNNNLRRVEVITPASLRKQWHEELGFFGMGDDELPITAFQNPQAIEDRKAIDKYAQVGLFVIDEAHNLRSINSKRYQDIMAWIEKHPEAHVLLLTATPINNSLSDLTNQILLGAKGDPNIAQVEIQKSKGFVIKNFKDALTDLEREIRQSINDESKKLNHERMKKTIRQVVHQFVVRNTRVGVAKNPDFTGKFPVAQPVPGLYSFNNEITKKVINSVEDKKLLKYDHLDLLSLKKNLHPLDLIDSVKDINEKSLNDKTAIFFIFQLIMLLGLIPYRWKLYQERFYGKDYEMISSMKLEKGESNQILSQMSIYGIIRTSYLKRLESSAFSIQESMKKYRTLLINFKRGLDKGEILSFKKLDDAIAYLDGDSLDEDTENLVVLDKFDDKYKKDELINDIEKDIKLIDLIISQTNYLIHDDSKILKLVEIIKDIKSKNTNNGKILIFSFYSDTIRYLEKKLPGICEFITTDNTGFATGGNGRTDIENLANRFSPKSKRYKFEFGEKEIDMLFATDVLSEGQNLQDCGIIINYDLHWNPVRMIQRNGRINRLGSEHDMIYIYNMLPEKQLEEYLGLVKRLEDKISLINFSIGLDQPIFGDDFEAIDFVDKIEDYYTKEGVEAIKMLEELEQATDIFATEDSFVDDLKQFDNNSDNILKKRVYEGIPNGKWGGQPAIILNKKRPEILVSGKLFKKSDIEDEDTGLVTFSTLDHNGNGTLKRIDVIEALQIIRSNFETKSLVTGIEIENKCNQKYISETLPKKMIYQQESQEYIGIRELKPSEKEVLKALIELGVDQSDMIYVRDALQKVSNEVRSRNLQKYLNNFKKNIYNIDSMKNLIEYSKESLEVLNNNGNDNDIVISKIVPFLYHVS